MVNFPTTYEWQTVKLLLKDLQATTSTPVRQGGWQFGQGFRPGSVTGSVFGTQGIGVGGQTLPNTGAGPNDPGVATGTPVSDTGMNTPSMQTPAEQTHMKRVWLQQQKDMEHKLRTEGPDAVLGEEYGTLAGLPVAQFKRQPRGAYTVMDREKGLVPIGDEQGRGGPLFAGGLRGLGMQGRVGDVLNPFAEMFSSKARNARRAKLANAANIASLQRDSARRRAINPDYQLPAAEQRTLDEHNRREMRARLARDSSGELAGQMYRDLMRTPAGRELLAASRAKAKTDAESAAAVTEEEDVEDDEVDPAAAAVTEEEDTEDDEVDAGAAAAAALRTRQSGYNKELQLFDKKHVDKYAENLKALINGGMTPEDAKASLQETYDKGLEELQAKYPGVNYEHDLGDGGFESTSEEFDIETDNPRFHNQVASTYKKPAKTLQSLFDIVANPEFHDHEDIEEFRLTPPANLMGQGLEATLDEGIKRLDRDSTIRSRKHLMKYLLPDHRDGKYDENLLQHTMNAIFGPGSDMANLQKWPDFQGYEEPAPTTVASDNVDLGSEHELAGEETDDDWDLTDAEIESQRKAREEASKRGSDKKASDDPMELAWAILKGV